MATRSPAWRRGAQPHSVRGPAGTYQELHEVAFASALRSSDLRGPVIDKGHRVADPLSGQQQHAIRRLRVIDGTLAVRLGIDALMLVHAVLLGRRSVVEASRGLPKAKANYIILLAHGAPLRVDEPARSSGLTTTGPSALAVPERLALQAAVTIAPVRRSAP